MPATVIFNHAQDPQKRKAVEEYQKMTEKAVDALKDDPELQEHLLGTDVKLSSTGPLKCHDVSELVQRSASVSLYAVE